MDRVLSRVVLGLLTTLALSQACAGRAWAAKPGLVEGDYCNEPDKRKRWSSEDKARTRQRVQAACKALGASPIICAYDDAIVWRESFGGEASVRHTQGRDADGREEHGLGPMGLSLRWHADKWPGNDEDPAFCTPEVSVVVAHEIYWRAVTIYGADSIADIQAIYAGRFVCEHHRQWAWLARLPWIGPRLAPRLPTRRECRPAPTSKMEARICERMAARGYNCHSIVRESDLGKRVPLEGRRGWAVRQAQRWLN
jgi:hypothetical protein